VEDDHVSRRQNQRDENCNSDRDFKTVFKNTPCAVRKYSIAIDPARQLLPDRAIRWVSKQWGFICFLFNLDFHFPEDASVSVPYVNVNVVTRRILSCLF
jgi:hypothetical protein